MKRYLSLLILITLILSFKTSFADILINENFSSGTIPTGWTNNIIQGSQGWSFRSVPVMGSPSGGNYAVFDDNALGAATIPNEAALTTPILDFTGRTNVKLKYSHYWFGVEFTHGFVEVSNDGGTTWNTVKDYHKITRGSAATPQDTTIDITALAANQTNVQVRFRYTDGSVAGRFWYLDDVVIYSDPDVGVTQLNSPIQKLTCGNLYSSLDSVTITINNFSNETVSNVPIQSDITGPVTVTLNGTVPGPIAPNATVSYTFPTTFNMTGVGTYNFSTYTQLVGDQVNANDTAKLSITTTTAKIASYPYIEDFDTSNGTWFTNTGTATRSWVHGALPATYLGGAAGQGDSWYYEWQSDGTHVTAKFDYLYTPVFDLSGMTNPLLSFDLKMNLSHFSNHYMGVQYSINGGSTWLTLGSTTDPNWYNIHNALGWGNQTQLNWTQMEQRLCNLSGQSCVQFRFRLRTRFANWSNNIYKHFVAIDNFKILDGENVGLTAFIEPTQTNCLYSDTQQVTVRFYNYGCNPVSNVNVTVDVTGAANTTLTGTIVGPVAPGTFLNYTFPGTINMNTNIGSYNFTAYVNGVVGDVFNQHDTVTQIITTQHLKIDSLDYTENFNSSSGFGGWRATGGTATRSWVHGALPATYLGGAAGQGDSWYYEWQSDGTHVTAKFDYLYTPVFDLSGMTNPLLSFDLKMNLSHFSNHYMGVQYSINGGSTWLTLGSTTDPNWYNIHNTLGWGNQTQLNWTQMEQHLCSLSGQSCVQFRFRLRTRFANWSNNIYKHFVAIDNFRITNTSIDVEPLEVTGCWQTPYELVVTIKNNALACTGAPTLTDLDLTFSVDGGTSVTQNYTGLNIPSGGTGTLIIDTATVPTNTSIVQVWSSNPNGLYDEIYENDTIYGNTAVWPNCNDHCSNAIQLGLGTSTASQNSNATPDVIDDPSFSGCGAVTLENTVWYSFTTSAAGDSVTVIFDNQACAPSLQGLQVSIIEADTACLPSSYTELYCNAPGDTAAFQFGPAVLTPNTTYYIAIDGVAGNNCDFNITLDGAITSPLPVTLTRFNGECINNSVELTWQTASEINNDFFEIERSSDAIHFSTIGTVQGSGNSNTIINYNYTDNGLTADVTYYRLKQVDFDGQYEYSTIIAVQKCNQALNWNLYPNPTTDVLNLEYISEENTELKLQLFDKLGRIVYQNTLQVEKDVVLKQKIDVSKFIMGVYSFVIYTKEGVKDHKKVVIRN